MAVLEIKNISKWFISKRVIEGLSLEVGAGEIVGFLGANGAGKTTTIKMIMGLLEMDEGDILINGFSINRDFERAISGVGALVENPGVYPYMSGYDHLLMCKDMHNGVTKDRIEEVVKFVGLENRIHDKTKKYSLGMKQRLAIAMAILHKPSLLVLDEPTNGLDAKGIMDLRNNLRYLAKEKNTAVFLSSHLLSEVEMLCDRVVIVRQGKIAEQSVDSQSPRVQCDFYVSPKNKAVEIILTNTEYEILHSDDNCIRLEILKQDIPSVNKLFINHDISIEEVKIKSTNLEEKFIDIIGGDNIA